MVATLHHAFEPDYMDFYRAYPEIQFVAISRSQARRFQLPRIAVIHHGIDLEHYQFYRRKQPYLSFLGRLVPVKGAHIAIRVARSAGLPLKIAGEVQPAFRDYFEREIEPHLDGKSVEYLGEADLEQKNKLLGNSSAMLFPVLWEEPFGLAAVEAMACGTPVVALRGGAATETVAHGESGYLCRSFNELVTCTRRACAELNAEKVRQYVEQHFSAQRMAEDYLNLYRQVLHRRHPRAEQVQAPQAA
jgi:glycosyltransferase involved in cell wall biosynthesis